MKRQVCVVCVCLVMTMTGVAISVSAQSFEGTILGVVRDDTGAVLPQTTVTVTDQARGVTRTVTTDDYGSYTVPGLRPGTYEIAAEREGFSRTVVENVVLEVNQTARVDLSLQVGAVVEVVTVEGGVTTVETETSALGQVVHSQQVTEIPLNGRNYVQLGLLSSGVAALPEGGLSSINNSLSNRTNTALIISGNRESGADYQIDGIASKGGFSIAQLQPSIDSIQEFKIQKSNFSAEFGSVAHVNIALKSGTNDFHGSLFYFHRNDALDARNFFDGAKPPPFKQHQWGASVGGPIVKDRTFFYGSFEELRSDREQTIRSRFPDPVLLSGDFSSVPTPIFDPATGSLLLCAFAGILCPTPFPGNIIPPARLDPIAQNIAAFWPTPNVVGDPVINHITTGKEINDFDQFQVRVDHRFSDNAQLFVRYSYMDSDNANPGAAPFMGQVFPLKPQQLAVNYSHVFSPTWLNEFRFGYNRGDMKSAFEPAPSNLSADIGFQNLDELPPLGWGLPSIGINPYFTGFLGNIGPPTPNSQSSVTNRYQFVEQMTFTRGRHTIKTGLDIRKNSDLTLNGIILNGSSTFVGLYTGDPLSEFLLGIPFVFTGASGIARQDFRFTFWNFFVQDDWRVTPKLTLNAGLRYEYLQPVVDPNGNQVLFEDGELFYLKDVLDQVPLSIRPVSQVGGVSRGIVNPDRNDFAPRFGFAFTPFADQKTVIRGGYGVFYGNGAASAGVGSVGPPFVNWVFAFSDVFFPTFTLGDLQPDPLTATNLNFFQERRNNRSPYIHSWNLTVQQELFRDTLFEIAYVGTAGRKLSKRHNANQAVPEAVPGGGPPLDDREPFPLFGEILMVANEANSSYHALQARVDKRLSNGFSLTGSYTWSKSMDDDSGVLEGATTQSRFNRRAERAPSDFDVPHQFVFSYVYELPFGTGKPWGGWEVSGITTFTSGTPFTIRSSTSNNTSLIFGMNRVNRVCDGNLPSGQRTPERWFDTSCFVDHATGEFGNSGRNILRQDGKNVWDISLIKNTQIGENVNIQFRAEFFNAFNITNFARPGENFADANYGAVTQNLRSGGRSREIQFGLKIIF